MVDRHDIDALLIGSLYGELSSADEARLRAHLESHPADRTALEGLSRAREAVRASRIFEVQIEPSQAVSALLLQEAARRAPRKARDEEAGEGWFARLRRSFLMHPAMAAAAMLVVVVGVAGTVYMRKGDHFAAPEVSAPSASGADRAFATPPPAADPAPNAAALAPDTTALAPSTDFGGAGNTEQAKAKTRDQDTAYRVGLADEDDNRRFKEKQTRSDSKPSVAAAGPTARPQPAPPKPEPAVATEAKVPRAVPPRSMLEVTTPQRAPMDLDDERSPKKAEKNSSRKKDLAKELEEPSSAAKQDKITIAPTAGRAPDSVPAAPSAPDRGSFSRAPGTPAGGGVSGAGAGAGAPEEKPTDPDLVWARDQHSRLVNQVKAGKCTDAAGTAVSLSNRAPGYYQQNVENDRNVKNCLAYINAERDKAERARATARRLSNETPPPAQPAGAKSRPAKPGASRKAEPAKADEAKEAPASKK